MLDLVKLGKVLALVDSSNEGEAAAAIESARRLLARDGKRFADLATMLMDADRRGPSVPVEAAPPAPATAPAAPPSPPPPPRPDFKSRRMRTEAPDAQSVMARHGSRDAVMAPCSREKLLRTAVARWSQSQEPPNERWTRSLSGWTNASLPRHMPPEVKRAVEGAYSLPTTVAGALAELEYWERRGQEIAAVRGLDQPDTDMSQIDPTSHLDLPAYARAIVIRRLVEHSLRAGSIQDALARAEYWRAHSGRGSWVEAAILADLRHLASMDRTVRDQDGGGGIGQPSHFRTASERREEVVRLLSDPTTAALPDREIARRVGVSPQTVGNLRRRVGDGTSTSETHT